jgi:DNA processing protein
MYNEAMRKEALITMYEMPGIGWFSILKAVELGAWDRYERFSPELWGQTVGLRPDQAKAAAEAFARTDPAARSKRFKALGITVITWYDEHYPVLLRHTSQPPWVLYAIGRVELLSEPSIAIVGTREPTSYGRRTTSLLARELSDRGLNVVSGLARGIDSMAHEGALSGIGGTIAVLGTPVNVVYPRENRSLYREIAEGGRGLLVSEVPLGTPFHKGLFPLRNRIIAGMTLGTVVVEAAQRSGSLITAGHALEMNRDVFAVPGPVSSPKSSGTNELIKKGAKLISTVEDIIEDYRHYLPAAANTARSSRQSSHSDASSMTDEEQAIYRILSEGPRTTDELHSLTSYPFGLLHSVLINLSIKRKIEQHPGSIYSVI